MKPQTQKQKKVSVYQALLGIDKILVSKGFHALSPWWKQTLREFYASNKKQCVLRVGRRGAKSSSLVRVGVAEGLFGAHRIPRGDIGVIAFVSVSRTEAQERLRTVREILDALNVEYKPISDGVGLKHKPIAFRVYTASIAGCSGFTSVCVLCDELSKWMDDDAGKNPATEVLSSIRPTMATQKNAKIFLSSSPMGLLDAHATAFAEGNNAMQMCFYAPSWVSNPTLSEEDTHALEPDEGRWAREFKALPLEDNETGIFSAVMLDRVTRKEPLEIPPAEGHVYCASMDPGVRANSWTMIIATRRLYKDPDTNMPRIKTAIVAAHEWKGTRSNPLDPDRVLGEIAAILQPYGCQHVISDQWSGDALMALARNRGIWLIIENQTAGSKMKMFSDLATKIANKEIDLIPHPMVRADLLSVKQRVTANGIGIAYAEQGDRHADFAPALASCVSALDRFGQDPPLVGPAIGSSEWKELQEALRKESRRLTQAGDYERRSGPFWKTAPSERVRIPNNPRARRMK